jgi:hypothetical protein
MAGELDLWAYLNWDHANVLQVGALFSDIVLRNAIRMER